MDESEIIGATIGGIIYTTILALIFAAIVHFLLGDTILSVLVLYIIIAAVPSNLVNSSISKSSAIVGLFLAIVVVFLIMNFIFPIILGPNIGFPYSMLGLGPIITGLIVSLLVGLFAVFIRA
nr:hypothetical protein [uncultured Methanobrevibacter sp.]